MTVWRCQRKLASHPVPYTNSTKQNAGSETDNSSDDTESFLLWNMKVHYRVQRSPPTDRNLSHINPVHTLRLCLASGFFVSGVPPKTPYTP
jgi:hypothetical protein